jgi:hypothetical protein
LILGTLVITFIKLFQLLIFGGYSSSIFVSDKRNDEAVNELIKVLKLQVHLVSKRNILNLLDLEEIHKEIPHTMISLDDMIDVLEKINLSLLLIYCFKIGS